MDPVMAQAREFYKTHGHLHPQKQGLRLAGKLGKDDLAEDSLARGLEVVRRARGADIVDFARLQARRSSV